MKKFPIFVISIFFLSTSLLSANLVDAQEELVLDYQTFSTQDNPVDTASLQEELSFLDGEIEEFEDDILALEEELKLDAQSFLDVETASIPEPLSEKGELSEAPTAIPEKIQIDVAIETPASKIEETPLVYEEILAAPILDTETQTTPSLEAPSEIAQIGPIEKAQLIADSSEILNMPTDLKKKHVSGEIEVNLQQAFAGSPLIYTLLFVMSIAAVGIWVYNLLSLNRSVSISASFLKNLQNKLNSNQFDDALLLCNQNEHVFSKMIACGIHSRRHGLPSMIEAMKGEGKRASLHFWQRMSLLNDIAIIAPMIGLLGTVLGMFYAFYDINRSIESISTLFDGLGVSVGTTVAGLIVAILSLILHSTGKYRLIKVLARVENEAQSCATLLDDKTSIYKG